MDGSMDDDLKTRWRGFGDELLETEGQCQRVFAYVRK
jgi:hypothetical protein